MPALITQNWFIEQFASEGSAIGFSIKEKLHEVKSAYQTIQVFSTEHFGNLMVIDDCIMLTSRDNFLYHEMMSHPALFTHADPKKVLIIGGGDCGTLREVLRHPGVEQATQVDIDEEVTRASEKYFPELCESNNDPRATLAFEDGIKWVQDQAEGSLDVIIVDSTDPVGPAEGLFAVDFYRDCFRALKEGGIFVQQTESPLFHTESIILSAHQDLKEAGFSNTHTLNFPQPTYPSGWWSATLAGKNCVVKAFDEARSAAKAFPTQYYNADVHKAALVYPELMRKVLGDS